MKICNFCLVCNAPAISNLISMLLFAVLTTGANLKFSCFWVVYIFSKSYFALKMKKQQPEVFYKEILFLKVSEN